MVAGTSVMKKKHGNRGRYRTDPLMPASDPMPNAMKVWHALGPLDEVARDMETRWGYERLPALVSEQTAARFGAAREYLDQQLGDNDDGAGDLDKIAEAAANLRRGWLAMEREALAAGRKPFDPHAWSFTIGDQPAAIVQDPAALGAVQKASPGCAVYTLQEIGNLLAAHLRTAAAGIAKAKELFPGATVTTQHKLGRNLVDDDIPF